VVCVCQLAPIEPPVSLSVMFAQTQIGHCDNDMILGYIPNFLTPDRLRDFDVISGISEAIWGPFTVFRNTEVTNSLFLHAPESVKDLFGTEDTRYFDEWGYQPTEFPAAASMTGILAKHGQRLGIRYAGGFPIGWDGDCKGEKMCTDCHLTRDINGRKRLLMSHYDKKKNSLRCTSDKCRSEVLLCHYQEGKKQKSFSSSLQKNKLAAMVESGEFHVSFPEGLALRKLTGN
jgi:hypothetical protein